MDFEEYMMLRGRYTGLFDEPPFKSNLEYTGEPMPTFSGVYMPLKSKRQWKKDLLSEYKTIAGEKADRDLRRYIKSSVNEGMRLYKSFGEDRVRKYALSQIEYAVQNFSLPNPILQYLEEQKQGLIK